MQRSAEAAAAPPRSHGGLHDEELAALGLDPAAVLDVSASCNPYGPCGAVRDAVRAAPLDRYPDPTAWGVRVALGRRLGVRPDHLVLGNGACELLWTLARVLVGPGERVVIAEPTFGEWRAAARACGAAIAEWRAIAERDFAIELDGLAAVARDAGATVVYLCAPNTPTGAAVAAADVARLAANHPAMTFVLDQSFLSLSARAADAATWMPANVVCVRSMTKDHGIPGVRLGYLVATPPLVARVEAARPAWSTSSAAQAAATAAVGADAIAFVDDSRVRVLADRAALDGELARLGLSPVPSTTGFVLVRVPSGDAAALRRRLLAGHGVLVRDCASFGLPAYVRLAARPAGERARVIAALTEELHA